MLQGYFYHKTIRKIVATFGTMFNNITLVKFDVNGVEVERSKVPLSYAGKEKWLFGLAYDSTLTKAIQVQLPRMSIELSGLTYDAARKLPTIGKVYNKSSNSQKLFQNYQPVPYDFSFDFNIYTRNIDDLAQILEQILPYFTPDFTVSVSIVQDPNGVEIIRDVPIILESTTPSVQYEGGDSDPRYVTANLQFVVKGYLFGPTTQAAIIRKAITNLYDNLDNQQEINLNINMATGNGTYQYEENIYSGNSWVSAHWTARVINFNANTGYLNIYAVTGVLPNVGDTVIGLDSGAHYTITGTNRQLLKVAQIITEPRPNTANVDTANGFSTTITEFPKIF